MAYGMVFRNSSGAITVDGKFTNMDLLSVSNAPVGQSVRWYPPKPCVMCLYSETGYTIAMAYANDNTGAWAEESVTFTSAGTGKLLYFAMKPLQHAPYGINIRNPSTGELVFSSRIKPMRVVDSIAGRHNMTDDTVIYERQFTAGRKYAVGMGNIPSRVDARGSWSPSIGTKVQCVNGKVTITASVLGGKTSGAVRGNIYTPVYNFLIIDVTGYV